MIHLVEHFFSIQGEGKRLGHPSIFLRFGGCNMRCPGFQTVVATPEGKEVVGCDTAYAVFTQEFKAGWTNIQNAQELIDIVTGYKLNYMADIVLTGGEPLIYASNPILVAFLEAATQKGHEVTFETNGSLAVDFQRYPVYKQCRFALSVKLACSGEAQTLRVDSNILNHIISQAKDSFYKFTLPLEDLKSARDEIDAIIRDTKPIEVYCMPMSHSKQTLEERSHSVIEFCKEEGYIYSDRLHIRIWDEIQGV